MSPTDAPPVPTAVSVVVRPAAARPRMNVTPLLIGAVIVLGIVLRVQGYARNPSLWIDEAMLAVNVLDRSPAELLEPLDWNQGAPVGFLLAAKLASDALGGTEFALRLVPLLGGLLGFAAFVPLAYRLLPTPAARLAVGLFALSPHLAGYCAEFKQYETDATASVLLTLLTAPVWRNEGGRWWLAGLATAGAIAVWCSHPAAFVLGGVGTTMLADAVARRDRLAFVVRSAVVGVWAASFAACYLLVLRKLGHNAYLSDYWAGQFLPLPPVRPGDWMWLVQHYFEFFQKPGGMNADQFGLAGLAGFACLIGFAATDWRTRIALGGPVLLALLASGLHKYPFANRLLLFAVPAAVLLVAHGTMRLANRLGTWPGSVLLGLMVFAPSAECYWLVTRKPIHAEEAREAMAAVTDGFRPGDRVYVYHGAAPAWAYYRRWLPLPADAVTVGETPPIGRAKEADQTALVEDVRRIGGDRIWVILSHHQTHHETAVRAGFGGACETVFRGNDAAVLRYETP